MQITTTSEVSETVNEKTELMIAESLQQELRYNRLSKMRKQLKEYNLRKENTPPTIQTQANTKIPNTTVIHTMNTMKENKELEQKIINWAKDNYKNYKDIQKCAEELKVRAGVIYVILKAHKFIQQTETTEYRVMSAYFKYNGRLADIVKETGLTVWIVAKTIENLGYPPKWQEYRDSRYITKSGTAGVGAEDKFRSLVPDALDMNEDFAENNPIYDFIVHEKTVDVKELTIITSSGRSPYWELKLKGKEVYPDYFCLFLCQDKNNRINGEFDILLIPSAVIPDNRKTLAIRSEESENKNFWYQFRVDPNSLAYMLGCEP